MILDKWKLYTGNTTAAFIEEIGGDIDFVFIDTAHVMPGEVLNVIEIFPFLKKTLLLLLMIYIIIQYLIQHIKNIFIQAIIYCFQFCEENKLSII